MIKVEDVFTPGRFPAHNYVSRRVDNKPIDDQIIDCLKNFIAFVFGPSKQGKTVLAEEITRKGSYRAFWVDARNFKSSDEFWGVVASTMGLTISEIVSIQQSKNRKLSGGISARLLAWFTGEIQLGASSETSTGSQTERRREIPRDPRQQAPDTPSLLVVDNFHYIQDRGVQKEILREVKNWSRDLSIIVIAITEQADYLTWIEGELRGRVVPFAVKRWEIAELRELGHRGFRSLNIEATDLVVQRLAEQSLGCPSVMQSTCLALLRELEIKTRQRTRLVLQLDDVEKRLSSAFYAVAKQYNMETYYREMLELTQKPDSQHQTVTMRAQPKYNIREDSSVTIPELVLHALKYGSETWMTFQDILARLREIALTNVPDSLIRNCLNELDAASKLVWETRLERTAMREKTDPEEALLHWNARKDLVQILDPYFLLFIRWSGYVVGETR
ncbi:MAG: AAA family ATPase [Anaerolineae bacterium]|nr:AAA family ATPase [Anaerolineae bacterium]